MSVFGSVLARPGDQQREEDADGQRHAGVLEGGPHAGRRAAVMGGDRRHDRGGVGRGEQARADAVAEDQQREHPVGEVDRQQHQAGEAARRDQQPAGGERAGAEPVGQDARQRPGDEEPGGERQHVDARPQRGDGEVVAVQRQPDAGQPDDQHELQAAAGDRAEQGGDVAGRERADAEQRQPEHRVLDPGLDEAEQREQRDAEDQPAERPSGWPSRSGRCRRGGCRR